MKDFSKIYSTDIIQYARFFLALSLFITLTLTPFKDLFPSFHIEKMRTNVRELSFLNYYLWFDNLHIPYFITLVILILTMSGFYTRYTGLLHWIATFSTFYTMFIIEGGDQISVIISFFISLICLFDTRKNSWITNKNKKKLNKYFLYFSYTTFFIIQLQMSLLYLNAGASKFSVSEWIDGTAVYYWFNNNIFGAPEIIKSSFGFLFENKYTVTLINWGVLFLEIILFVGLFLEQKYKYLLFVFAFIFHFLIFLIHGLGTFWLSMTGCLILYLFNPTISFKENIKAIFYSISELFINKLNFVIKT